MLRFAPLFLYIVFAFAQQSLSKDDIMRMVQQGIPAPTIAETIRTAPRIAFNATDADLAQLEKQGVPKLITGAMLERTQHGVDLPPFESAATGRKKERAQPASPAFANSARPAPLTATSSANTDQQTNLASPPVDEIGVYFRSGSQWAPLPPEIVNWKTGGVLKSVGTLGVVKGDINGKLRNSRSHTHLPGPGIDVLVYAPEGTTIEEYQLIKLREHSASREFRTITGGIFHVSGGADRDTLEFESQHIARRTWSIHMVLGAGEYGLLPPFNESRSASAQLGKLYTFSVR